MADGRVVDFMGELESSQFQIYADHHVDFEVSMAGAECLMAHFWGPEPVGRRVRVIVEVLDA